MTRSECLAAARLIPGMTWPQELAWLYDTFAASKSHAEIGVYCGKTLFASCGAMSKARVYAVESFACHAQIHQTLTVPWRRAVLHATLQLIHSAHVEFLELSSVTAAKRLGERNIRLDSVYIDGGHSYEQCRADIHAWRALLNNGGALAGHDYFSSFPGVIRAVNEAFTHKARFVPNTRIWYWKKGA